jgi:hypothetical protein
MNLKILLINGEYRRSKARIAVVKGKLTRLNALG